MTNYENSINTGLENVNDDSYEAILRKNNLKYESNSTHFFVGSEPSADDRIIFISVIISQIPDLLQTLIPKLIVEGLSFQMVKNKYNANVVLSGSSGSDNIGKVIIIFISELHNFLEISQCLVNLTLGFNGPAIPNHIHLGGQLFTTPNKEQKFKNKYLKDIKVQIINNKYLIRSILHSHIKGDVFKAIYFKDFFRFGKCVIKQGKRCMWSDDKGRDVKDRLLWQQKAHDDLYRIINIPKIVEFFEHHGDSYLVMTYIDGITLEKQINNIYSGTNWVNLSRNKQLSLLDLLLRIVEIVENIHQHGYVHRDLTDINFLISSKGQINLIDWELAYRIDLEYPSPPFELGTLGFISPEQKRTSQPTVKEDIFALGALMILFFTHLPPVKFDLQSLDQIKNGIVTLTRSEEVANLVIKCINKSPNIRPTLTDIRIELLSIKEIIKNGPFIKNISSFPISPDKEDLKKLIILAFNGLPVFELLNNGELLNKIIQLELKTDSLTEVDNNVSLFSSITGLFYIIYLMKNLDFTFSFGKYLNDYINIHQDFFFSTNKEAPVGILYGSAGKALAIHYGILSGALLYEKEYSELIQFCFNFTSENFDLANGTAGQLLAACLIFKTAPSDLLMKKIELYKQIIIEGQHTNGAWYLREKSNVKFEGLKYGMTGVIFSLIKCDELFPNEQTKMTIIKGLHWLNQNSQKKKDRLFQKINNVEDDNSLLNGKVGLVLIFLSAYEHFKNTNFRDFAEKILWQFDEYPVDLDYSFSKGLSGLGIVYLEAARICSNREWKKRAEWIYTILSNTYYLREDNTLAWFTNKLNDSMGGVIEGNEGIILFLLKFYESIDTNNKRD